MPARQLTVLNGPRKGQTFRLEQNELLVGRGLNNAIVLAEPTAAPVNRA